MFRTNDVAGQSVQIHESEAVNAWNSLKWSEKWLVNQWKDGAWNEWGSTFSNVNNNNNVIYI